MQQRGMCSSDPFLLCALRGCSGQMCTLHLFWLFSATPRPSALLRYGLHLLKERVFIKQWLGFVSVLCRYYLKIFLKSLAFNWIADLKIHLFSFPWSQLEWTFALLKILVKRKSVSFLKISLNLMYFKMSFLSRFFLTLQYHVCNKLYP